MPNYFAYANVQPPMTAHRGHSGGSDAYSPSHGQLQSMQQAGVPLVPQMQVFPQQYDMSGPVPVTVMSYAPHPVMMPAHPGGQPKPGNSMFVAHTHDFKSTMSLTVE